jgi:hypothetical protein
MPITIVNGVQRVTPQLAAEADVDALYTMSFMVTSDATVDCTLSYKPEDSGPGLKTTVQLKPNIVQIVVVEGLKAGRYTYALHPPIHPSIPYPPLLGSFRIIGEHIAQLETRVLSSNDAGESIATDRTWEQLSTDMRTDHGVDLLLHCGDSRYAGRGGTIHETFGSARQGHCMRNAQNVFTVGPRDLPSATWPGPEYRALY